MRVGFTIVLLYIKIKADP